MPINVTTVEMAPTRTPPTANPQVGAWSPVPFVKPSLSANAAGRTKQTKAEVVPPMSWKTTEILGVTRATRRADPVISPVRRKCLRFPLMELSSEVSRASTVKVASLDEAIETPRSSLTSADTPSSISRGCEERGKVA